MAEIKTSEVVFQDEHSDYGVCYFVTCPECKETVTVVEFASRGPKCSCGYEWSVWVQATGQRLDGFRKEGGE